MHHVTYSQDSVMRWALGTLLYRRGLDREKAGHREQQSHQRAQSSTWVPDEEGLGVSTEDMGVSTEDPGGEHRELRAAWVLSLSACGSPMQHLLRSPTWGKCLPLWNALPDHQLTRTLAPPPACPTRHPPSWRRVLLRLPGGNPLQKEQMPTPHPL